MNWYYHFNTFHIIVIALFFLIYLLFILRVRKVSKVFNAQGYNIIWKLIIRLTYFILLILAVLGPSFGEIRKEIKTIGKDIYIAVDLSESMNASDVQPTRLEKAKFEISNLINQWPNDRIGLIVFTDEAFVQCPLTYDRSALNLFIHGFETRIMPQTGTNLEAVLQLALEKYLDDDINSLNKSKVLVLISDGEDFGSKTKRIAESLELHGIRLFTLGIGTDQGGKISKSGKWKKDAQGNDIVSHLNRSGLKKLATTTGGNYFEINNKSNEVTSLIKTVSQIKGQLRDTRKIDVSANKFYYFLLTALGLMVFDVLLTIKTIFI